MLWIQEVFVTSNCCSYSSWLLSFPALVIQRTDVSSFMREQFSEQFWEGKKSLYTFFSSFHSLIFFFSLLLFVVKWVIFFWEEDAKARSWSPSQVLCSSCRVAVKQQLFISISLMQACDVTLEGLEQQLLTPLTPLTLLWVRRESSSSRVSNKKQNFFFSCQRLRSPNDQLGNRDYFSAPKKSAVEVIEAQDALYDVVVTV